MNHMEEYDKELYHYGVVGMKWGIRRAKKLGETYNYKSYGQKQYERKLAKQKQKGASAEKISATKAKLQTFKTRDKARQSYAESTTVGSEIARNLLLGTFGAGTYSRLRASGKDVATAAGLAALSTYVPITGALISKHTENEVARKKNNKT